MADASHITTKYIAYFSTNGGRFPPRNASTQDVSLVVRSDPKGDAEKLIRSLRGRWRHICLGIFAPWKIYWFFDEHDFRQKGGKFLYEDVLTKMQKENESMLAPFCKDWSERNSSNFQAVKFVPANQLFHGEDLERYGIGFLQKAKEWMSNAYDRALMLESRQLAQASDFTSRPQPKVGKRCEIRSASSHHHPRTSLFTEKANYGDGMTMQSPDFIPHQQNPIPLDVPLKVPLNMIPAPYSATASTDVLNGGLQYIIQPPSGQPHLPFPGLPTLQPVSPAFQNQYSNMNANVGFPANQLDLTPGATTPGRQLFVSNAALQQTTQFGNSDYSTGKFLGQLQSPIEESGKFRGHRNGSFGKGRGRTNKRSSFSRKSSVGHDNRFEETPWKKSPEALRSDRVRRGSWRQNGSVGYSGITTQLATPLEKPDVFFAPPSNVRAGQGGTPENVEQHEKGDTLQQSAKAMTGHQSGPGEISKPQSATLYQSSEVPVTKRITRDSIGSGINDLTRAYIKVLGVVDENEVRQVLSPVAPVRAVEFRPHPGGVNVFVDFYSTDDLRKAVAWGVGRKHIKPETPRHRWTEPSWVPPFHRQGPTSPQHSRSALRVPEIDAKVSQTTNFSEVTPSTPVNTKDVRNTIFSPQDARSSIDLNARQTQLSKTNQKSWADIASGVKAAEAKAATLPNIIEHPNEAVDIAKSSADHEDAEPAGNSQEAQILTDRQEKLSTGEFHDYAEQRSEQTAFPGISQYVNEADRVDSVRAEQNTHESLMNITVSSLRESDVAVQDPAEEDGISSSQPTPCDAQFEATSTSPSGSAACKSSAKKKKNKNNARRNKNVQAAAAPETGIGASSTEPMNQSLEHVEVNAHVPRILNLVIEDTHNVVDERPSPEVDQAQNSSGTNFGKSTITGHTQLSEHNVNADDAQQPKVEQAGNLAQKVDITTDGDKINHKRDTEMVQSLNDHRKTGEVVAVGGDTADSMHENLQSEIEEKADEVVEVLIEAVPKNAKSRSSSMGTGAASSKPSRRSSSGFNTNIQELKAWTAEYDEVLHLLPRLRKPDETRKGAWRQNAESYKMALEKSETAVQDVDSKLEQPGKTLRNKLRKKRKSAVENHQQQYDNLVMLLNTVRNEVEVEKKATPTVPKRYSYTQNVLPVSSIHAPYYSQESGDSPQTIDISPGAFPLTGPRYMDARSAAGLNSILSNADLQAGNFEVKQFELRRRRRSGPKRLRGARNVDGAAQDSSDDGESTGLMGEILGIHNSDIESEQRQRDELLQRTIVICNADGRSDDTEGDTHQEPDQRETVSDSSDDDLELITAREYPEEFRDHTPPTAPMIEQKEGVRLLEHPHDSTSDSDTETASTLKSEGAANEPSQGAREAVGLGITSEEKVTRQNDEDSATSEVQHNPESATPISPPAHVPQSDPPTVREHGSPVMRRGGEVEIDASPSPKDDQFQASSSVQNQGDQTLPSNSNGNAQPITDKPSPPDKQRASSGRYNDVRVAMPKQMSWAKVAAGSSGNHLSLPSSPTSISPALESGKRPTVQPTTTTSGGLRGTSRNRGIDVSSKEGGRSRSAMRAGPDNDWSVPKGSEWATKGFPAKKRD